MLRRISSTQVTNTPELLLAGVGGGAVADASGGALETTVDE